jgi:radical SAM superfamily enzyme YgiQ (UPF0313 family)
MGVVLHYASLARAGLQARVVRPLDPPFEVPPEVLHGSMVTFSLDPPMEERLGVMERAEAKHPEFFASLLDRLTAGPERVFGLSIFRNNVDLTLWVARMLKQRLPSAWIVIGGPEAIEEPEVLGLPWVDVVVGASSESVIVPLMQALVEEQPHKLAALEHIQLNGERLRDLQSASPAHPPRVVDAGNSALVSLGDRAASHETPPEAPPPDLVPDFPTIDYAPLVPLFFGDDEPTVPLLLNWGCPYSCHFCSNRTIYTRFTAGDIERVLTEVDGIVDVWKQHAPPDAPGLNIQLSDATTNALPKQFDALLRGIIDRHARWGLEPTFRGQTLFDTRITAERVKLMRAARFDSTFFGLDTASDRLRRSLHKPGATEQVREAMLTYHRVGHRGLHFGIPVGLPGESEEDFEATLEFVEWALELEPTIASITVLPYTWFLSAQDPGFSGLNKGASRGVLWRTDGPAGDPAVRARRMMRVFELVDGRVPCNSPLPPYVALSAMLGARDGVDVSDPIVAAELASLERWMDQYGRRFDQITSKQRRSFEDPIQGPQRGYPGPEEPDRARWRRAAEGFRAMADDRTSDAASTDQPERAKHARVDPSAGHDPHAAGPWSLEGLSWREEARKTLGLVVVFRHRTSGARFGLTVDPVDPSRPTFQRTRDFNVGYLNNWEGHACEFDETLMQSCLARIERAELGDARADSSAR